MTFNTLIASSDSKFAVRAYAEHLDSIKRNYQKVVDLLSTAAVTDPEDLGDQEPEDYFSTQINNEGFNPLAYIIIGDQEFELLQAMVDIYNGSETYSEGLDATDMDFPIEDSDGLTMGYRTFVDGLISNLHSITAAWAASAAALEETVSARISLFRDKMQTLFADAYDDVSNSVEYWTKTLSEQYSPSQWVPTALSIMQVQEAADQDVAITETDLYQYTGASPLGPLAFDFAANAVAMTGYVALQAYVGVCKGIISLGERIYNWGKQTILQIVNDPDDLYIVDDSAPSPSVDGCYMVNTGVEGDRAIHGNYYDLLAVFGTSTNLDAYLEQQFKPRYLNKWLHFKLLCGELFIKPTAVGRYIDHVVFRYDYKWRPYVLDCAKMLTFAKATGAPGTDHTWYNLIAGNTWDEIVDRLMLLQAADIYADSNTSELDKANGLAVANETVQYLAVMALHEACGLTPWAQWTNKPIGGTEYSSATNADFIRQTMGYKLTNGTWAYEPTVGDDAFCNFVMLFLIHSYDRYSNPLSYSFLPYTNDSENFEPGQWAIKTDNQNYEAFNSFGTKAVIAVAVIVATIYIGLKIRKWKRTKYLQRASFIGRIDNKMWSNQPITTSEWNKYIKYSRKLSVSTLMDSKMTRVKESIESIKDKMSSNSATSVDAGYNLQDVITLIKG